ncbi:replication endonuclease [Mesorhizobium sp. B2-2-2]|nr:replication endonuclease [Mesorhizobium sp. B2-2-2]
MYAEQVAERRQRWKEEDEAERRLVADEWAELDREYSDVSHVADLLPKAFGELLRAMPEGKRKRREAMLVKKVGWENLTLIDLDPMALTKAAETRAWRYRQQFPADDFPESDHNKRRCEKWWRKRLTREQGKAILNAEDIVQAVGGPNRPGRPLSVSDYTLSLHQRHIERTEEIMAGLRLVQRPDPSVQIPMLEVDQRSKDAADTKRRLFIDMMLRRWADLGWRICWITVTLPGRYVCHATNEATRKSKHDPITCGPIEAMEELQARHHRVLALLRERGIRPCGWWDAQPQQSGTPHRHYVLAVPSLEDARGVCDGFRREFSSLEDTEGEGEDRGCDAGVIGDSDPRYKTRIGKDGNEETARSVAMYTARYSTKHQKRSAKDDSDKGDAGGSGDDSETTGTGGEEQKRFEAWKWLRRARTHTWLGLDSQRAPSELWDTLWANAQRSDYDPDDARMALALREMRRVHSFMALAAAAREAAHEFPEGDEDREAELEMAAQASDDAALHAWHAAIALGMWPDSDLDRAELDWLAGETSESENDPLPPVPLRVERESAYGEIRKEIVGAVGVMERFRITGKVTLEGLMSTAADVGVSVETPEGKKLTARHALRAFKEAGFRFSRRPDGSLVGFDLSGEILLRTDKEWVIVDKETAARMVEESKTPEWDEARQAEEKARLIGYVEEVGLSFSPTDPSLRAAPATRVDDGPPG